MIPFAAVRTIHARLSDTQFQDLQNQSPPGGPLLPTFSKSYNTVSNAGIYFLLKRIMRSTKGSPFLIKIAPSIFLLFLVVTAATNSFSMTFTVTKTADTEDGTCDSDCSLREAVAAANSATTDDTIDFQPSVFGTPKTIVLGGTQLYIGGTLTVGGTLTINGPGSQNLVISGNNRSRTFLIGQSSVLLMSGVTLSDGNDEGGGAVRNFGTLTLINAVVSNSTANQGGGIDNNENHADLTLINSTIMNNTARGGGGGIVSFNKLSVINSTIRDNTAPYGAGIWTDNTLYPRAVLIDRSTISNNRSVGVLGENGGGITCGGTATIRNSTISGNTTSGHGGGISNSGTLIMSQNVIADNTASSLGGGISNRGSLTLDNSTVGGNTTRGSGGGIYSTGMLTAADSVIQGNVAENVSGGGGINNADGTISLDRTSVSGNRAPNGQGGGIYSNYGTITLVAASMVGNSSSNNHEGGAIFHRGDSDDVLLISNSIIASNTSGAGAGVFNDYAATTLIDNTLISANRARSAGGGIRTSGGSLTLQNSTVSENTTEDSFGGGGGISVGLGATATLIHSDVVHNTTAGGQGGGGILHGTGSTGATINLTSSLVADNAAPGGSRQDVSGTIESQGFNLIEDPSGLTIVGLATGNIIGVDPKIGPLADNGGPTPTHALLPNSPAIDSAGLTNTPPTDQRGFGRPTDGDGDGMVRADIGAFEVRPTLVTNLADGGPGSFRQALADVVTSGDMVVFTQSMFDVPRTIALTSGEIEAPANRRVMVAGPGSSKLTLNGNNQSRVFSISEGASLTLAGITIAGGNGSGTANFGHGGGVLNMGELDLADSVVRDNSATGNGGGIASYNGKLTSTNSVVTRNTAQALDGGGLYLRQGSASISNSTINANSAGQSGGGIHNLLALISVANTTISGNTAVRGGGIANAASTGGVGLNHTTVAFNTATSSGGGVSNQLGGTVNSMNSIFSDNAGPLPDFAGRLNSIGYNLIEDASGTLILGIATGNILGVDPRLDTTLRLNGAMTSTHALSTDSPAIDKAVASVPALRIDQRRFARPFDAPSIPNASGGNAADIGAYEYRAVSVSGRVTTPSGQGLRNAAVSIIDARGVIRNATTSSFGIFSFEDVAAGGSYTVRVIGKRYRFAPRFLEISDDIPNVDFIGLE
jgi:CSLREA domain-containing protein